MSEPLESTGFGSCEGELEQFLFFVFLGGPSLKAMITPPQKFNIDTKHGHIEKELPFPNHHFGYPAVSFRGL